MPWWRPPAGAFVTCFAVIIILLDLLTKTTPLYTASEKDRRQMYNQEMKAMSETAKARMEGISGKASTFTRATHVEHVKGMFKVIMLFSN